MFSDVMGFFMLSNGMFRVTKNLEFTRKIYNYFWNIISKISKSLKNLLKNVLSVQKFLILFICSKKVSKIYFFNYAKMFKNCPKKLWNKFHKLFETFWTKLKKSSTLTKINKKRPRKIINCWSGWKWRFIPPPPTDVERYY